MTSSQLKLIAILTMAIDHIGAVLYPDIFILRLIGRIAFPIFAYLIAIGYQHTHSVARYLMRLLLFAIISEVPFDLAFYGVPFYWAHQNIFFTLSCGLLAIHLYQQLMVKRRWLALFTVLLLCLISQMLMFDYGIYGVALLVFMHFSRTNRAQLILGFVALSLYYIIVPLLMTSNFMAIGQGFQLLALPLILGDNGRRGWSLKYFFYAFYPAHLLLLWLIVRYQSLSVALTSSIM